MGTEVRFSTLCADITKSVGQNLASMPIVYVTTVSMLAVRTLKIDVLDENL